MSALITASSSSWSAKSSTVPVRGLGLPGYRNLRRCSNTRLVHDGSSPWDCCPIFSNSSCTSLRLCFLTACHNCCESLALVGPSQGVGSSVDGNVSEVCSLPLPRCIMLPLCAPLRLNGRKRRGLCPGTFCGFQVIMRNILDCLPAAPSESGYEPLRWHTTTVQSSIRTSAAASSKSSMGGVLRLRSLRERTEAVCRELRTNFFNMYCCNLVNTKRSLQRS
mmetsp:Transcript_98126/g.277765  ORF Transcript_98126/g.277765 Transcript_98126/m.277765 type:complete len:221 (-) Transcript_98126:235-897(-)